MRRFAAPFLCTILMAFAQGRALAGPPYETDDPDPTQYRNYEIYFHVDYHRIDSEIEGDAATLEINYGLFPNTQFSVDIPTAFESGPGGTRYEFGDLGIGLKYRFVQESATSPQVAFYPSVTLGIGALLLPIWAQKSIGKWTIFGGGGVQLDDGGSWQEGLAVTRDLSGATNVGIEIFHTSPYRTRAGYTDIGFGYIGEIGAYHALLFSGGRALGVGASAHAYLAYEWRLGPHR